MKKAPYLELWNINKELKRWNRKQEFSTYAWFCSIFSSFSSFLFAVGRVILLSPNVGNYMINVLHKPTSTHSNSCLLYASWKKTSYKTEKVNDFTDFAEVPGYV